MRNQRVRDDMHYCISDDNAQGVADIAAPYIEFLEGQEDRLRKFEECVNNVNDSTIPNKADFLKHFEVLKVQ